MNNLKTHFDNFFKIYLLFSILILTGCPDQERVINTTKPQFKISLAEISSGPYYSDSCLDCTDISKIEFQVSLSENGEPLANKTIDFTTSAIEGIFPYTLEWNFKNFCDGSIGGAANIPPTNEGSPKIEVLCQDAVPTS